MGSDEFVESVKAGNPAPEDLLTFPTHSLQSTSAMTATHLEASV